MSRIGIAVIGLLAATMGIVWWALRNPDRPTPPEVAATERPNTPPPTSTPAVRKTQAPPPAPALVTNAEPPPPTEANALDIHGVVRNAAGETVGNAVVAARRLTFGAVETDVLARVRTDDEGRYRLVGIRECCLVDAHTSSAVARGREANPGDEVNLTLSRGGRLVGRVSLARDLSPCADATVAAYAVDPEDRFRLQTADVGPWLWRKKPAALSRSNEDGAYSLPPLAPGDYFVRVQSPRAAQRFATERPIAIRADTTVTRNFALGQGIRISGRITDAKTDRPIAGATVTLAEDERREATTDAEGRYELTGIPMWKVVNVIATAPGYGKRPRGLVGRSFGPQHNIDITLMQSAIVTGRVLDPVGKPVANARVGDTPYGTTDRQGRFEAQVHAQATTDTDGRYRLNAVPTGGIVRLYAAKEGVGWARSAPLRGMGEGMRYKGVDFHLGLGGRITGTVRDDAGRVLPGAAVRLVGHKGRLLDTATTEASGQFELPGIAEGVYDVEVMPPGLAERRESTFCWAVQRRVPVAANGTARVNLTLRRGATIRGEVTDAQNRPIANAVIKASPALRTGANLLRSAFLPQFARLARTDERGQFTVTGLITDPPLDYRLDAVAEGYERRTVREVTAGSNRVAIQLRQLVQLTGTTVSASDPVREFIVTAERVAGGTSDSLLDLSRKRFRRVVASTTGAWSLRVSPGTYLVAASTPDGRTSQGLEVTVNAGAAPTPLTLVLEAGGTLQGRVLYADRKPVDWASIEIFDVGRSPPVRVRREVVDDSRFELTGLGPGQYFAWAFCRECCGAEAFSVQANGVRDVTIRLARPTDVTVSVTDGADNPVMDAAVTIERADGIPAAMIPSRRQVRRSMSRPQRAKRGVSIDLKSMDEEYQDARRHLTRTNVHGLLTKLALLPGRYRYVVEAQGHRTVRRSFTVGSRTANLSIKLGK